MSGFWSLDGAPKWWFDKRAWVGFAVGTVLLLGARWYYGPQRVPQGQVVFYSTAWCPYSTALREHLNASRIPYVERDIEGSWGNFMRYMWAAGRNGSLPVVQVGPKVVAKGFYQAAIDQELKAAGYHPLIAAAGPDGASQRR